MHISVEYPVVTLKQIAIKFFKEKERRNALIALLPAIFIYYLSYSYPIIASLGILSQVLLPLITIAAVYYSGEQYLKGGYATFKDISKYYLDYAKYLFNNLLIRLNHYISNNLAKKFSVYLAIDRAEKPDSRKKPTFNMDTLVSLSCITSIIYALSLGTAAPLVVYLAPLVTLSALGISHSIQDLIKAWVTREARARVNYYNQQLQVMQAITKDVINEFNNTTPTIILADCILMSDTDVTVTESTFFRGESKTNVVRKGEVIPAGSQLLTTGPVKLLSTKDGTDSDYFKYIAKAVESSFDSKFKKRIDTVASYFVPFVLIAAALSLIVWTALSGLSFGFAVMMDVFFAACPCALALAADIPFAILKKKLLNQQIVITKDSIIENYAKANTIVFDKTGTLTTITLKDNFMSDSATLLPEYRVILSCIVEAERKKSLARRSDHYASAVLSHFAARGFLADQSIIANMHNVDISHTKTGVAVDLNTEDGSPNAISRVCFGSLNYLKSEGFDTESQEISFGAARKQSDISLYIAIIRKDGSRETLPQSLDFEQKLRDDAKDTIAALKQRGFDVHICSGDTRVAAQQVATELGFSDNEIVHNIQADCRPTHNTKLEFLESLKATKTKDGKERTIVTVGDGFNDLPILQADGVIGIAMGHSADAAGLAHATIAKLSSLLKLKAAFSEALKNQQQIFNLSVIYNSIAMLCAAVMCPMHGMVTMTGCFGVCMGFSSLFAMAWASTLYFKLNTIFNTVLTDGTSKLAETVKPKGFVDYLSGCKQYPALAFGFCKNIYYDLISPSTMMPFVEDVYTKTWGADYGSTKVTVSFNETKCPCKVRAIEVFKTHIRALEGFKSLKEKVEEGIFSWQISFSDCKSAAEYIRDINEFSGAKPVGLKVEALAPERRQSFTV